MKQLHIIVVLPLCMLLLSACADEHKESDNQSDVFASQTDSDDGYQLRDDVENINDHLDYSDSKTEKVVFAGGCFWGVEAFMEKIYGVDDVVSGYVNGTLENPSYEDVIQGKGEFAEAVEISYDPERVDLKTLVDDLFRVIDPTSKNKQGNDVGVQYRTGVYAEDEVDLDKMEEAVEKQQADYDEEIVTEVEPLENFYTAEEEHQDYLEKNPNGYCHVDLSVADDLAIDPVEKDKEIVEDYSVSKDDSDS